MKGFPLLQCNRGPRERPTPCGGSTLPKSTCSNSSGSIATTTASGMVTPKPWQQNLMSAKTRPATPLSELCDRGHVERLVPGKYAIAKWRERDEPADDLPT